MQAILLNEHMRISDALNVRRGVTAIVGGGGKTTLLLRLANELRTAGARVIVTTTTHIYPPRDIALLDEPTADEIAATLEKERLVCVGKLCRDGKLTASDVPIETLAALADHVLVEADGAKGLSVKTPAMHEPVLPAGAELVVAVAGLDAIGGPIRETMFRYERYCANTGVSPDEPFTAAHLSRLLTDDDGAHKGVSADMRYAVLLNKADDEARVRLARRVAQTLDAARVERVVIAALGRG